MPLYKTITISPSTQVFVWKVEETVEALFAETDLTSDCRQRIESMKSDEHRRQFLSIRLLLMKAGYTAADMYYDDKGKPHLKNDYYISVTHSHNFSGIIISSKPVGIDIEKQRNKVLKIAHRFTPLAEYKTLANDAAVIRKLTIVWGAKEAVYKILNIPGLSFLNHIYVEDFNFEDMSTTAEVNFNNNTSKFLVKFIEFESFSCVYALSSTTV